jgi:hypothetical protein
MKASSGNLYRWRSIQPLEDGQGHALSSFISIQESKRLLPGAAEALPGVCRCAPVAGDLEGIGRGSIGLRLGCDSTPPQPDREFTIVPRKAEMRRHLEASFGFDCRAHMIFLEPAPLRSRGGHWGDVLDIAASKRQIVRLIERRLSA